MNEDQVMLKGKSILVQELDLTARPEQISDEEPLFSPLIRLDSIGLLKVILALEAAFGVEIDEEDLMQADLETVANLIELVKKKLVS